MKSRGEKIAMTWTELSYQVMASMGKMSEIFYHTQLHIFRMIRTKNDSQSRLMFEDQEKCSISLAFL